MRPCIISQSTGLYGRTKTIDISGIIENRIASVYYVSGLRIERAPGAGSREWISLAFDSILIVREMTFSDLVG